MEEHDGNASTPGTTQARYVYAGSRMLAKISGGVTRYYVSDRLSARLVLDTSGNVVGRQGHLPFGEDFGESGEQEKHHFTSYERDSESGLDYAINRGYSPGLGRFQSADPYRASGYRLDPQSWNRYTYARNDPANRIDRFGREDQPYNGGSLGSIDINGGGGKIGGIGGGDGMLREEPVIIDPGVPSDPGTGEEGDPPIDWEALWKRWQKANPCEKNTALSYPFAAFKIIELREQADAWFMGQPQDQRKDDTHANAVQHCYFSCLATIHLDFQIAKAFGDAHECNTDGNPEGTDSSRHDLHNNEVGRTIGYNLGHDKSDEKCLKKCQASEDLRWPSGNPLP